MVKITGNEWSFLENVAQATFANPFGEKRKDLDLIIIGGTGAGSSTDEVFDAAILRVRERVDWMNKNGSAELKFFEGSRRDVMRTVFLFYVFHRYLDDFDALIQTQSNSG